MKSYIYKIYSPDNKLHYYGLTTSTIQKRFELHKISYNRYINQKSTNYCSSYTIFDNYNIDDIQIQIIEEYDDIPLNKLRQREKYYIQNFTCVNITGKDNIKLFQFYTLNNIQIQESDYIKNNIHIFSTTPIQHDNTINLIIQLFGYTRQDNRLNHKTQIHLSKIKTQLNDIITIHYTDYTIDKNNILDITNKILHAFHLQIIYKKIIIRTNNTSYFLLYLNIQPCNLFNTQEKEILDTHITDN